MHRILLLIFFVAQCLLIAVVRPEDINSSVNDISGDAKDTGILIEAVTASAIDVDLISGKGEKESNPTTETAWNDQSSRSVENSGDSTNSTALVATTNLSAQSKLGTNTSGNVSISGSVDEPVQVEEKKGDRVPVLGDCVTDTMFVVDSTASVAKIFDQHREYIGKVAELLNSSTEGNHVSLLVFSGKLRHRVTHSFSSSQNKDVVSRKVKDLPFLGGVTSTGAALDHAFLEIKNKRKGPETTVNVVVVTDGFSYDPVEVQSENLRHLPKVRTFTVSIGSMMESELRMMAGSDDHVFRGKDSYIDLAEQLTKCEEEAAEPAKQGNSPAPQNDLVLNENTVAGAQSSLDSNGNGKSEERTHTTTNDDQPVMDHSQNKVSAEGNGAAEKREEKCPVDVVFVFDASGSLRESFGRQLEMATKLVDVLSASPTLSHVSVVKFSGKGRASNPHSKEEIKEIILSIPFFGGTTYTREALEKAMEQLTSSTRSGKAKQIVVIFTDGFSYEDTLPAAKSLHEKNIAVLAVAINDKYPVNRVELEILTWHKSSHIFTDKKLEELKKTLEELTKC